MVESTQEHVATLSFTELMVLIIACPSQIARGYDGFHVLDWMPWFIRLVLTSSSGGCGMGGVIVAKLDVMKLPAWKVPDMGMLPMGNELVS
jgi:hypothetical protein